MKRVLALVREHPSSRGILAVLALVIGVGLYAAGAHIAAYVCGGVAGYFFSSMKFRDW